jgi:hypothetical protein
MHVREILGHDDYLVVLVGNHKAPVGVGVNAQDRFQAEHSPGNHEWTTAGTPLALQQLCAGHYSGWSLKSDWSLKRVFSLVEKTWQVLSGESFQGFQILAQGNRKSLREEV